MPHTAETLSHLRRPKLLIRTARAGLQDYRRNRDLKGISGIAANASGTALVELLLIAEAEMEQCRHENEASYNVRKHIRIMTALLAEASALPVRAMAA